MRPVFQDAFGWNQGNCVWACVASVFELPLEQFQGLGPPNGEDLAKWTEVALPGLEIHDVDLRQNYRMLYTPYSGLKWTCDPPQEWRPPHGGYWLAVVESHAVRCPPDSDWWPGPGLHCVVMRGSELAHDPNPAYQGKPAQTPLRQLWWTPKRQSTVAKRA